MEEKYFGKGNDGKSTLSSQFKISKSDSRFSAIGVLDELSAEVYLILSIYKCEKFGRVAREILAVVDKISNGIASPRDSAFFVTEEEISRVNRLIGVLMKFNEQSEKPLNELAARFNKARTTARKAERELVAADLKYGSPKGAIEYLNGLSALLKAEVKLANSFGTQNASFGMQNTSGGSIYEPAKIEFAKSEPAKTVPADFKPAKTVPDGETEKIVASVIKKVMDKIDCSIGLDEAKKLTEIIEKEAERRGKKAVIAVCNEQGNPISVHVMDGAFLVSFDVAVKKAYTAAALKMSTMELSELVKPNGTFYGLQNDEKLMIIGGGVPLKRNGKVVGGLGVSGGTGEEDHSLCEFALSLFE